MPSIGHVAFGLAARKIYALDVQGEWSSVSLESPRVAIYELMLFCIPFVYAR